VCVCPVYALTFDSLDLETISRSSSYVKVIGSRSTSQEQSGELCERKTVVTCEIKHRNRFPIVSAAERVLKLFQNYFGDNEHVGKYLRAAIGL